MVVNTIPVVLKDVLTYLPDCKRYVNRTITGRIIESYELQEDGWHDTTLRDQEIERLEREIANAKRIIDKEAQTCDTM